jgi:Mg2+/Co2+ transporter CorB
MSLDLALSIAAIAGLLLLSALFSASETALTAVSKARMFHLASEGSRAARQVNRVIANRERMLGALLLGNTFLNILASALATSVTLAIFDEGGVAVATAAMTAIILVFVEVLPKTLAIVRTDRVALLLATPVHLTVTLLAPIVAAVRFVVWRVLSLFGVRDEGQELISAQEEIRGAIELHHQEGGVEKEHRAMLGGVLDLADLKVADVMVHRKNMEAVDGSAPAGEIVEKVLASSYTRFPIWRDSPENIVGVLFMKDLLTTLVQRRGNLEGLDVMSLVAPPWFIPDTTTLEEQLKAFRDKHSRFALVVDEYGVLQGLVTLEDIVEEIFGDIAERRGRERTGTIRPQADGSYTIEGLTAIRDLNRELGWNLPDEEATTVAGLVINEARIIPEAGQVFSFHGFRFEVLRKQRNQIVALRITPLAPAEETDDSG